MTTAWTHTAATLRESNEWLSRRERWQPRPEQVPPEGEWRTFLFLAGRGAGKTRAAAEWIHHLAKQPNLIIGVVGRTAADVRDICVLGESGILATAPPWARPIHKPSQCLLQWPNGTIVKTYSADEPEGLRGKQYHYVWADELCAWSHVDECWGHIDMGMRLGNVPKIFVSTTPRPLPVLRKMLTDHRSVVVRGRTADNIHLPAATIEALHARYGGTRTGRQELEGEILDDAPGALWRSEWIEEARVPAPPELSRVVVAVDPAVSVGEDSDETGIVVVGVGVDGDGYVLHDASGRWTPGEWARRACALYGQYHADCVVAEVNQGGDMVAETLRQVSRDILVITVRATRGKQVRAQPLALRYEQRRVHHVGIFRELEDQLVTWDPLTARTSPDRLDALVWGFAHCLRLFEDETVPVITEEADQWEQELIERATRQWWE